MYKAGWGPGTKETNKDWREHLQAGLVIKGQRNREKERRLKAQLGLN